MFTFQDDESGYLIYANGKVLTFGSLGLEFPDIIDTLNELWDEECYDA